MNRNIDINSSIPEEIPNDIKNDIKKAGIESMELVNSFSSLSLYESASSMVWQSPSSIALNYISRMNVRSMAILDGFMHQGGKVGVIAELIRINVENQVKHKCLRTYLNINSIIRKILFNEKIITELTDIDQDRVLSTHWGIPYRIYQSFLNLIGGNAVLLEASRESDLGLIYVAGIGEGSGNIIMNDIIETNDLTKTLNEIPGITLISPVDPFSQGAGVEKKSIIFPENVIARFESFGGDVSKSRAVMASKFGDTPIIKKRSIGGKGPKYKSPSRNSNDKMLPNGA